MSVRANFYTSELILFRESNNLRLSSKRTSDSNFECIMFTLTLMTCEGNSVDPKIKTELLYPSKSSSCHIVTNLKY